MILLQRSNHQVQGKHVVKGDICSKGPALLLSVMCQCVKLNTYIVPFIFIVLLENGIGGYIDTCI